MIVLIFDSLMSFLANMKAFVNIKILMSWMQICKSKSSLYLRNHMAQRAIEAAERDDFSEVDRLFKLLNPGWTL